jgi:hypothetical protein
LISNPLIKKQRDRHCSLGRDNNISCGGVLANDL